MHESSVHYVRRHAPVRPGPAANRRSSREISPRVRRHDGRKRHARRTADSHLGHARADFLYALGPQCERRAPFQRQAVGRISLPDRKKLFRGPRRSHRHVAAVAYSTRRLARGHLETVRQPGRRHADHAADHRGLQAGAQGELPVQRHELLAAETDRGKGLRRIPRPADPRIAVGAGLHVERVQSLANLRHGALRPDRGRPHSEPRHHTRLRP